MRNYNKKNTSHYTFIVSITILILSPYNQYAYTNQMFEINNHQTYKQYKRKYIDQNQKHYKHFGKYYLNNNVLIQNKLSTIYPTMANHCFSEINIGPNALNILNTYSKNYKELVFNQFNLLFLNEKIIYNFGIGYKKQYRKNWIVGNNIFYDTILFKNKKKIFSIGSEFLRKKLHISSNSYHNISDNTIYSHSSSITQCKKFLPYACDIRIKSHIPYFKKTITGKINLEYYLKEKKNNHQICSQNMFTTINNYKYNNIYQLTMGVSYTPISIFTFDINRTIYSSIHTNKTTFNITANYKLYIPKITSIINHNKIHYDDRIFSIDDHYTINRNNNILLNYKRNNSKYNNNQNIPHCITHKNTTDKSLNSNNKEVHDIENPINSSKKTKCLLHPVNSIVDVTNNPTESIHNNKYNIENIQSSYINNTKPDSSINTNTTENKNLNIFSTQTPLINLEDNTLNNNQETHITSRTHNNNKQIIPPPPPLPNILIPPTTHTHAIEQQIYQDETSIVINNTPDDIFKNDNKHLNDYTSPTHTIQNINQYKQEKFNSLGNEQHLKKLNNITKKRKKTISTSSANSNNSDTPSILQIIERQSALITDSDNTDNDDNYSITSHHEFSDN